MWHTKFGVLGTPTFLECSDVVKILIESGAELNMQTNNGRSALMIASKNRRMEVTQMLLDHHADTSIRDTNGKNALSWACETGHTEIVELLLSFEHKDTSIDQFSILRSQTERMQKEGETKCITCIYSDFCMSMIFVVVQEKVMIHCLKR